MSLCPFPRMITITPRAPLTDLTDFYRNCQEIKVNILVILLRYQWIILHSKKTRTKSFLWAWVQINVNRHNRNLHDQAETLLHSLERAAANIGLYVNAHKTEYMCYNQTGDISTLEGTPLKLVDKFTYLGSSVESTEKDIETRLAKAWTAINRLSIIWKSDLTDKIKRSFFQAAVTSILLYGCTTWMLIKRLEKKLDGNYTRMLRAILNKSWRQHPTRHQLYGHLPPITKTIQVSRARHAGHCWRDELIRDVLLWTPTHGRAKAGRPARTYIQQLCEDTGCCPEDLPRAMNNWEEWRERVRDIRATSAIWWWFAHWQYTITHLPIYLSINLSINEDHSKSSEPHPEREAS